MDVKRLRGLFALLFLGLLPLGCDLGGPGPGRVYLQVHADTAWAHFDSLFITWKDSASGAEGEIFRGKASELGATRKVEVPGYEGGKIVIIVIGRTGGKTAYEERIGYEGKQPGNTVVQVIPVDKGPDTGKVPDPDTVVAPVVPGAPTLAWITAPAVITFRDSLSFEAVARVKGGELRNYAFDFDGDGLTDAQGPLRGDSATLRGGFRFPAARIYAVSLRVHTVNDSSVRKTLDVTVKQDKPSVEAGRDTTVFTGGMVKLAGKAKDTLGILASIEWRIGEAPFRAASLDTAWAAPERAGDIRCILRAVDDDGQSVEDSLWVHVIAATKSALTSLVPSAGELSPPFKSDDTAYTLALPHAVDSLRVTASGNGDLLIDGKPATDSQPGPSKSLAVGETVVRVTVTHGTSAARTYSIRATRQAASAESRLASLVLSRGILQPAFSPDDTAYAVSVNFADSILQVYPVVKDGQATVSVDGTLLLPGVLAVERRLGRGLNTVRALVTAPDGSKRTYSIAVTRGPSDDASLSSLVLTGTGTAGTVALEPSFYPYVYDYAGLPVQGRTGITVRLVSNDSEATLKLQGAAVKSGVSTALTLPADTGFTLSAEVSAADGKTKRTYTVRLPHRTEIGYASGSRSNEFFRTWDKGRTWTRMDLPPRTSYCCGAEGGFFLDPLTGVIAGDRGTVQKTTDGGKTWSLLHGDTVQVLYAFTRTDARTYYAGGLDRATSEGVILKTTDAGATWTEKRFSQLMVKGIVFFDANAGVMVGRRHHKDTSFAGQSRLYRTTDAGATWTEMPGFPDAYALHALGDGKTAFEMGGNVLHRTADRGATWSPITVSQGSSAMDFPTSSIGYLLGGPGIRKSVDGGATWIDQVIGGNFWSIHCWDAKTCIVGGDNNMLRTEDGGENWNRVPGSWSSVQLQWMHFLDP